VAGYGLDGHGGGDAVVEGPVQRDGDSDFDDMWQVCRHAKVIAEQRGDVKRK
jgi:hypothetical protein